MTSKKEWLKQLNFKLWSCSIVLFDGEIKISNIVLIQIIMVMIYVTKVIYIYIILKFLTNIYIKEDQSIKDICK